MAALVTVAEHLAFAGITSVDPTRDAALAVMLEQASEAVRQHCQNGSLTSAEYTIVLDGPSYPSLVLPYAPVAVEGFELYVNAAANGDPAAFTSEHLRTMYQDYMLDVGPANVTESPSGIVRLLGTNVWGLGRERPLYSLATKVVPMRGCIKVVYTAGYDPLPALLTGAVNIITRKLYNLRKLGVPVTSESLNGYSYGAQQAGTAAGILAGDPTVRDMLKTFTRPQIGNIN